MSDLASDDELLLWAGSLMTAGSLSAPNNPKREGCRSWIFFFLSFIFQLTLFCLVEIDESVHKRQSGNSVVGLLHVNHSAPPLMPREMVGVE